jgi:hypothetical protein
LRLLAGSLIMTRKSRVLLIASVSIVVPAAIGAVLYALTGNLSRTVELAAVLLAVLALGFASEQYLDARTTIAGLRDTFEIARSTTDELVSFGVRLDQAVKTLGEDIARVEAQLPTREIGAFPDFLGGIVSVLRVHSRRY